MAKKQKKKVKFEWKGYVNVNITEAHVSELEAFVSDDKTVLFEYNAMLTTGYQIKLFWDDYSEAIKASAVCHDPESPNFGYCLSSYADDWYTALGVLIYKHLKICDRDWDSAKSITVRKFG